MQLLTCAIIFVHCCKFCVNFFQCVEAVLKVSETAAPEMTRLLLNSGLVNQTIDKVSKLISIAWSKIICVKHIFLLLSPCKDHALLNTVNALSSGANEAHVVECAQLWLLAGANPRCLGQVSAFISIFPLRPFFISHLFFNSERT